MRPWHRAQVWTLVVAAGMATATAQCGGLDTTGRARTSFAVRVRGTRAEAETSAGWHITFERALVALGPLRWYEGEPVFGWRRLRSFGLAFAHPGHYVPGEALADITAQQVVDLLAPEGVALARAEGVTGEAHSATVELRPPRPELGTDATPLNGATLWLRGTARRGETVVRFEGGLALDLAVTGIPARGTFDTASGEWELTLDLGAWLDRADFSTLPPPSSSEEYVTIPADAQVRNALYRGATSAAPYQFTWVAAAARDR
jgi:hypothetical protein